jgi:hypothetical protein
MKRSKTKTVGFGYVNRWRDGSLGWYLPQHLCGLSRRFAERPNPNERVKHEPAFLCKITVIQVFNKRGRPIIRYNGGKKKPAPQPDGGKS